MQVSDATSLQQLAEDLADELLALHKTDPAQRETTLLIHPHVLQDFLDIADGLLSIPFPRTVYLITVDSKSKNAGRLPEAII